MGGDLSLGWLTGWRFRRPVTIDNTQNSNDLTDYQVLVIVDTASLIQQGKMQPDGDDIRFTDTDGTTLLPYWLEGPINATNTKIWVKVPSIPAQGTKVIYFYYGNPNATSESSIANTFIREIDGAQPLKGSWHIDEGSGGTIYDQSGNNNSGTIYGATWVNGRFGKALNFDGVDDYVKHVASAGITGDITVAAWVKTPTTWVNNYPMIVTDTSDSDAMNGWNLYVYRPGGENQLSFILRIIDWGSDWVRSTFPALTDTWYHVVGVREGNLVKLYINGVLDNTKVGNYGPIVYGANPTVEIGVKVASQGPSWSVNWRGIIDEVQIYSRALSDAEISDLYNFYGYSTPNYPGRVLVRKRSDPEPSTSVKNEETVIVTRRLLIIGI